jgi:putative ABC transport system permease protein
MSFPIVRQLHIALQRLLQRPGQSLLTILVLGVGLGTMLFLLGLVNGLVLKPMPFPDADRLMALGYKTPKDVGIDVMGNDDYLQIRGNLQSLEDTGIYRRQPADIVVNGAAHRYEGCMLSSQMLGFLGVNPISGRKFTADDDRAEAPAVALISETLWRNDFSAAPDIVGRSIQINGEAATIIGVMPKGFAFPTTSDVWLPARIPQGSMDDVFVVGKLKPGTLLDQGRADLEKLVSTAGKLLRGQREGRTLTMKPLALSFVGENVRSNVWLMFVAGSLVFLLACANIANLQLAQAMSRQRDLAIRSALGARRSRLLREQLAESFVLSIASTLVALVITRIGTYWLENVFATNGKPPPYFIQLGIDGRMLAFAALAALITTALAGFVPAWRASRTDVQEVMREGGKGSHGDFFVKISKGLVVFEIALTVILLVGAGTFIHGLERVLTADFSNGVDPARVLTARLDAPVKRYPDEASRARLYEQIGDRLRADPAVAGASLADTIPGAMLGSHEFVAALGQPQPADGYPRVALGVSDNHFAETYGLKLISGRMYDERDAQSPVVVVDERLAAMLWPNQNAIGQKLALHPGEKDQAILNVIGVVSDLHLDALTEDALPGMLVPLHQVPTDTMAIAAVIKGGDPLVSVSSLARAVAGVDSGIPIYAVRTQAQAIDTGRIGILVLTQLFTILGLIALLLAAAGLYGILSFAVIQRSREIGIRRALGARKRAIVINVGRQLLVQLMVGLAIGIGLALPWSSALADPKLQTQGHEGLVFAVVIGLIVVVAVIASLVPIARALRVDPMVALRYE